MKVSLVFLVVLVFVGYVQCGVFRAERDGQASEDTSGLDAVIARVRRSGGWKRGKNGGAVRGGGGGGGGRKNKKKNKAVCPDGWLKTKNPGSRKCVLIQTTPKPYQEAVDFCLSKEGTLLVINSTIMSNGVEGDDEEAADNIKDAENNEGDENQDVEDEAEGQDENNNNDGTDEEEKEEEEEENDEEDDTTIEEDDADDDKDEEGSDNDEEEENEEEDTDENEVEQDQQDNGHNENQNEVDASLTDLFEETSDASGSNQRRWNGGRRGCWIFPPKPKEDEKTTCKIAVKAPGDDSEDGKTIHVLIKEKACNEPMAFACQKELIVSNKKENNGNGGKANGNGGNGNGVKGKKCKNKGRKGKKKGCKGKGRGGKKGNKK